MKADIELEKCLIASILQFPGRWPYVRERIEPEDISHPVYRYCYESIDTHVQAGNPIRAMDLREYLIQDDRYSAFSRLQDIDDLLDVSSTSEYTTELAVDKFQEAARRRRLKAALHAASERLESENAADVVSELQTELASLHGSVKGFVEPQAGWLQFIEQQLDRRRPKYFLGPPDLDRVIGGVYPGELVILASRPGIGKTTLAVSCCRSLSDRAVPTDFFSLEMDPLDLVHSFVRGQTGMGDIRGMGVDLEHVAQKGVDATHTTSVRFHDATGIHLHKLCAKIRNVVMELGSKVIFVDNLSLLRSPADAKGGRPREIAACTAALKTIAKQLKVVIILICHINRAGEGNNGAPTMANLRDSGSIEQDADVVILMHREIHNCAAPTGDLATDALVPKRRTGRPGKAQLLYRATSDSIFVAGDK